MSYRGGQTPRGGQADRLILPAAESTTSAKGRLNDSSLSGVLTQPHKPMPKRKTVTAVACLACKHRKSKCDGQRPICSSCTKRGQTDCEYDISSDQRRTTALKEKIEVLKQEAEDLKAVILSVCTHSDQATMAVVRELVAGGYHGLREVAHVLRVQTGPMAGMSNSVPEQPFNAQNGFPPMASHAYITGYPPGSFPVTVNKYYGHIQRQSTVSPLSESTMSTEMDYSGPWEYKVPPQAQAWSAM